MNRWNLTDELKHEYTSQIEEAIEIIENNPSCKIDLTETKLNPSTLIDLLKDLGYEEGTFEPNGWEWDVYQKFYKEDKPNIIMIACGMTFELGLCGSDDEDE